MKNKRRLYRLVPLAALLPVWYRVEIKAGDFPIQRPTRNGYFASKVTSHEESKSFLLAK